MPSVVSREAWQPSGPVESRSPVTTIQSEDPVARSVFNWVESVVVGLNLCPFAKRELVGDRIRVAVSNATRPEAILTDLEVEIERLLDDESVETTLLVLSDALQDFPDFNQFLALGDGLLEQMGLTGVFQIAHFHPAYQFAGTGPDDAENYTNRSPYPMLHLLRERSLDRVLRTTEHAEQIPVRNIELMNQLGADDMRARLAKCLVGGDS